MSQLQSIDKQYVANTYNRFPVEIVSGKGSIVCDSEGKKYIDMGSGIAVNSFGRVMEGYVDGALLAAMSDGEIAEYQSRIAGGGDVALYQDDLNWPLGPLSDSSDTAFLVSNAANYEDLSNNTQFTINGVKWGCTEQGWICMDYVDMTGFEG